MEPVKKVSAEKYYMNVISLLGMLLSAVAALVIVLFIALQEFMGFENPYLEIITLFLLPGAILFGGVLTYFGAWRVRSKHRRHPDVDIPPLPRSKASSLLSHPNFAVKCVTFRWNRNIRPGSNLLMLGYDALNVMSVKA
jgi:hypothetical protein